MEGEPDEVAFSLSGSQRRDRKKEGGERAKNTVKKKKVKLIKSFRHSELDTSS